MDYAKEYEKLEEKNNEYFKVGEGVYKITPLEQFKEPTTKTVNFEGKPKVIEQTDLLIECDKKRYHWSITKSNNKSSLWGQMMFYCSKCPNIVGNVITLIVKGQGKLKNYTILEVSELKTQQ